MSEHDPTTRPTIDTILERLNAIERKIDRRFDSLEARLEQVETLVDRSAGVAFEVRADLRELRAALREHNLVK